MFSLSSRLTKCQTILDQLATLEHEINLSQFSSTDQTELHMKLVRYLCWIIEYNSTKFWFQKPAEVSSSIMQRIRRHYAQTLF